MSIHLSNKVKVITKLSYITKLKYITKLSKCYHSKAEAVPLISSKHTH